MRSSSRQSRPLTPEHLHDLDPRISIPRYDRAALREGIVHIGVGGFHRAHQAVYLDDLCNDGSRDWAISGAGVMGEDSHMADTLHAQDGLYTVMTRSDRATEVRVVGTIVDYLHAAAAPERLVELLAQPATRIVSLTITESGYPVDQASLTATAASSSPTFAALAKALDRRRSRGLAPFTVLSCDNIIHNGDTARIATLGAASEIGTDVPKWIESHVPFPNSVVDRITPATTDADRDLLVAEYGLVDRWPVVTEPFRHWVIEDTFVQGRPRWEDVGAVFTSDVTPHEILKLRILNGGHSAIAYLAALAGFDTVDKVVGFPLFARYLRSFFDEEVTPALPPIPHFDVERYKTETLHRFSNPAIGDRVSRLCVDGSSKVPTFLIPTVKAQLSTRGSIDLAALAIAGWCQYLVGIDDSGHPLEVAPDPLADHGTRLARASLEDPAAFLDFAEAVGEIGEHPRFRASFVRALISLRRIGTLPTVRLWVDSHKDEN